MCTIEIPKGINNIMSTFYYLGLWYPGDKPTVRETRIKLFYSFYHLLFPISLMVSSVTSDSKDESIFLAEMAIGSAIISLKLFYIIWRKDRILDMITRIGVYPVENREEFTLANDKMKRFMKFATVLFLIASIGGCVTALAPFFLTEKNLILKVAFPFDWKNNDFSFWLVNAFIFTEVTLTIIAFQFSVIIWYLMFNCALRYEILGSQIKNMGVTNETSNKRKTSEEEKNNIFLRDLISAIDSHQHLRDLIHQLESFFSRTFLIQIVTSGLSICGSTYCLAYNVGETLVEYLFHIITMVYHIYDIFMIMYFGNEIKLSSDRLSYCLFESNWIDKPQEIKKCMIVFCELLQQPHELVVGKLYPLTLETFRRILNFAYNSFNILKNFK